MRPSALSPTLVASVTRTITPTANGPNLVSDGRDDAQREAAHEHEEREEAAEERDERHGAGGSAGALTTAHPARMRQDGGWET